MHSCFQMQIRALMNEIGQLLKSSNLSNWLIQRSPVNRSFRMISLDSNPVINALLAMGTIFAWQ